MFCRWNVSNTPCVTGVWLPALTLFPLPAVTLFSLLAQDDARSQMRSLGTQLQEMEEDRDRSVRLLFDMQFPLE